MKTFQEIRETDEQIKAKMSKMKGLLKPKLDVKGKLKKVLSKLPGADLAKKLAESELGEGGMKRLFQDIEDGANAKKIAKKYALDLKIAKQFVDDFNKISKAPRLRTASNDPMKEGKMIWNHKPIISDGTMQMGIFDGDKGKAEEAARQLIFFLRKNKKTKIGESDPEQNDSNADIAKYSEELSKLVFDDKMLDDLEPNGNNSNQMANDIVIGRLRDLGVRIK